MRIKMFLELSLFMLSAQSALAESPPIPPPDLCILSVEEGQYFSSENFPQRFNTDRDRYSRDNTNCNYTMKASSSDKKVLLTFYYMELDSYRCESSYLTIYDNEIDPSYLCGSTINNEKYLSMNDELVMNFYHSSWSSNVGWLAKYESVDADYDKDDQNSVSYLAHYPANIIQDREEEVCVDLVGDQIVEATLELQQVAGSGGVFPEPPIDFPTPIPLTAGKVTYFKDTTKTNEAKSEKFQATLGSDNGSCLRFTSQLSDGKVFMRIHLKSQDGQEEEFYRFVNVRTPAQKLFVQTDKGKYKQGDTVKFRLFSINDKLKNADFSISEVKVQDPSFRTIQQWRDVDTVGIQQKEFDLFEEAQLGKYTIKTKYDGDKENTAEFEVAEYTLPRFEVTIKSPGSLLAGSDSEWKVCAKYTHGAPVPGTVQANFSSPRYGWRSVNKEIPPMQVEAEEKTGCAKVILSSDDLKSLTENKENNVNLKAEFVEEGTGESDTAEQGRRLDLQKYRIEFGSSSNNFIVGGFPYSGEIKVISQDGSPVVDENLNICARLFTDLQKVKDVFGNTWSMDEDDFLKSIPNIQDLKFKEKCHEMKTDQQGKISFLTPLVDVPKKVKKLSLKVTSVNEVPDKESGLKTPIGKLDVDLTHSDAPVAMSIQSKEKEQLKCDQENTVPLFVAGNKGTTHQVKYYLLSGGQLISSGEKDVELSGQSDQFSADREVISVDDETESNDKVVKKLELPFKVAYSAYPDLTLAATLVSGNSTLSDSHDFKVAYCTSHKVALKLDKDEAKPREAVQLEVEADENSMCGVAMIDKSVDILGNPNKVTPSKIAGILSDIKSDKIATYPDNYEVRNQCSELHNLMEMFQKTGRKLHSNQPIFKECDIATRTKGGYEYYGLNQTLSEIALRGPSISASSFQQLPQAAPVAAAAPPLPEAQLSDGGEIRRKGQAEPAFNPENSPPLRTEFPETWLFELEPVDKFNPRDMTAPDTLTSWTAEAVCMSPTSGLGVAQPQKLVVSQEFFADLRLPAFVKRGESFPLNISVFNNLDQDLPLLLKIEGEGVDPKENNKNLCVKASSSDLVSINTKATEIGEVNVTVSVEIRNSEGCAAIKGEGYSDSLQRPLVVKAEGIPVEQVESEMICLGEQESEQSKSMKLTKPAENEVVEGSERVLTYVSGDVMAASLKNIGNLVRLPTGCGEQNMVKLAPNVYLLQYLKTNKKENKEIEEKALQYMQTGYDRQDKYRHPDGAYSIWGGDDSKDASTWLTAFVVKVFSQASKYIKVDKDKLKKSGRWLVSTQQEDGCFDKRGYVHSSSLQGGNSPQSLNAFVLTALSEYAATLKDDKEEEQKMISSINKGLNCMLNSNLTESDIYTISLAKYATLLAKNKLNQVEYDEEKLAQLNAIVASQRNESLPGSLFWDATKKSESNRYWWYYPRSLKVEVTAYNIMSLVLENKAADAVNAVKWLARQRNSQGGFQSTQDTVVGLQALSVYGEFIGGYTTDLKLQVKSDGELVEEYSLDQDNKEILNAKRLATVPDNVEFSLSGTGCAVLQTVHKYNVDETKPEPLFTLKTEYRKNILEVCTSYNNPKKEETDMAILEVEMVSGYVAKYPEDLENEIDVKKVEVDEKENKVVLYFDSLNSRQTCIELELDQEFVVSELRPARVLVYDYYNTDERLEKTYTLDS